MLEAFVTSNRATILARAQARVSARSSPLPSALEVTNGLPVFLDQLCAALRLAMSTSLVDHEEMQRSAANNGLDLLRLGLTVAQVVRDYGDVCQVITELAIERSARIPPGDFQILNLCLDDAIAAAVSAYAGERESTIEASGHERLGELAHELRNLLSTAVMSYDMVRAGRVSAQGSTGAVLGRSLMGLRDLIDRSLAEVRLDAGVARVEPISVAGFLEDVEIVAQLEARARGVNLMVSGVERDATITGDRHTLSAILTNLLQNAFKFTPANGNVTLKTSAIPERVRFDVEDECGGLPPGAPEELFRAFEQRGADRSGIGLGLSICMKAAKANQGELRVRNLPGKGCVFTLDLPRTAPLRGVSM